MRVSEKESASTRDRVRSCCAGAFQESSPPLVHDDPHPSSWRFPPSSTPSTTIAPICAAHDVVFVEKPRIAFIGGVGSGFHRAGASLHDEQRHKGLVETILIKEEEHGDRASLALVSPPHCIRAALHLHLLP
jgi:hypothetical protein